MQMIVLGMHRSGTSMVARLLNMMGAYFATEEMAMPPTVANPKGYWERKDVRELNDDVISALGMSWDNISDFEPSLLEQAPADFQSRAQKIIFNMETQRPWMIKDPRFSLLLPLWRPFLEIPVAIYVYRCPLQVAQSLKKREGFSLMLGIALWEKYNVYGLGHCAELPKILVCHEELMNEPVSTVKKLYKALREHEVQGLRLPADKEILAFIDDKLFHEHSDTQTQNAYLNRQQAVLVKAFESGEIFNSKPLPQLSHGAGEILAEYKNKLVAAEQTLVYQRELTQHQDNSRQQQEQLTELQDNFDQVTQTLQTQTAEFDKYKEKTISYRKQWLDAEALAVSYENLTERLKEEVIELRQHPQILEQQIETLKEHIAQLEAQVVQLEAQQEAQSTTGSTQEQQIAALSSKTSRLTQDIHQLVHWITALRSDITATFNSLTWKAGSVVTRIVLALLLKKPGKTARDHIETLFTELENWQSQAYPPESQRVGEVITSSPSVNATLPVSAPVTIITSPTTKTSLATDKNASLPKPTAPFDPRDYQTWIKYYDTLSIKILRQMQQRIAQWDLPPLVSIVMPTYNTQEKWLRAAIESVQQQIYPHWELCIVDDASTASHVRPILEKYAATDNRIKVQFRAENGHISAASNTGLEMVTGELVAFLDHDDVLARHALFWVVQDSYDFPNTLLWFSDEDKIDENGVRHDPYFKSDWNHDLFLSHNLITHLAVYRQSLVERVAGFRVGFEGAQDYDFALRAIEQISPLEIRHIPRILYHWRVIEGSTAMRPEEKPYALIAAQRAIHEYLVRRGANARVMNAPEIRGASRVQYLLPQHPPKVNLIIPTYNGLDLLRQCVESIFAKTDYPNYEILIIDNASDDPATLAYMQQLEKVRPVRILDYPYPFNYADMNNMAVEQADGEIIGLLNNDLEVINADWLTELVSHALRPDVGVVGARLWYPNDTLQHGGVVLGIGGVAGHAHKGFPRGHVGYCGRAALIQNFSAVTGACMLMRKSNFLAVGGLDAQNLKIALNDVDLCLKMSRLGLRVVWTPYAELYHHESASRGYEDTPEKIARYEKERLYMKSQWPHHLLLDPAYSPNLTLETQDFVFAWPPRVSLFL
jgi:glycosyltransferase involved in cell wall biosynthesis/phage shock protein A